MRRALLCRCSASDRRWRGRSATSPELQQRHPEVPWADIVAFRNFLVHEYFGIHWPIVWQTATDDAPRLRSQIAEILLAEFPG
jgi:uncharacterized protein with HEPN domain